MIQLSSTATQEIKRLQTKQPSEANYLRFGLTQGGCATWTYVLEFTDHPNPDDCRVFVDQELQLLVAENLLPLLEGMTVDFSGDLMGGGFRFKNPHSKNACGCGQSFDPL